MPTKTSAHTAFMVRTLAIYTAQKRRAIRHGQRLDYTKVQLRSLVRGELGQPCPFCTTILDTGNYWIDHDIPVSRGGSFGLANLVVMCQPCNRRKSTLSLADFIEKQSL
jgi:5-methylcytosine-specific restriction endonuclease McrA